jgi:hypothetical protein
MSFSGSHKEEARQVAVRGRDWQLLKKLRIQSRYEQSYFLSHVPAFFRHLQVLKRAVTFHFQSPIGLIGMAAAFKVINISSAVSQRECLPSAVYFNHFFSDNTTNQQRVK